MMKTIASMAGFFALLSCGTPTTDDANDAAGTGSPFEAREVSGVRMLTTDYNYDRICQFLDDGFVRGTFNLGGFTEMTTTDTRTGCRYVWPEGAVTISFGGYKPYSSIYDAEYTFDRLYQPIAMDEIEQAVDKPSLFGPSPQGTASEWPAIRSPKPEHDSLAFTGDSLPATRLTEPAYRTPRLTVVANVGDKALWNADKQQLHVLYLHHILNIGIKLREKPAVARQRAVTLARVIVEKLHQADSDVSEYQPR